MKLHDQIPFIIFSYLYSQLPESQWHHFSKDLHSYSEDPEWREPSLWLDPGTFAALIKLWREQNLVLSRDIEKYLDLGYRFTFPGQWDYPSILQTIPYAPVFLSYIGTPVWNERFGFAIVGSREPLHSTEVWCERELPKLARQPELYFVSGGALGVDQIAHRISLREQAPTVAVIPSGLSNIYPASLNSWQRDILKWGGAILSEYGPNIEMQKHRFDRRNRLISGLSVATLILQARIKSGTLLTAQHCLEQGRSLWVVPSHPTEPHSRGGLELLRAGAQMVLDYQDLRAFLSAEINSFAWTHKENLNNTILIEKRAEQKEEPSPPLGIDFPWAH
jgi:DNA processing protein